MKRMLIALLIAVCLALPALAEEAEAVKILASQTLTEQLGWTVPEGAAWELQPLPGAEGSWLVKVNDSEQAAWTLTISEADGCTSCVSTQLPFPELTEELWLGGYLEGGLPMDEAETSELFMRLMSVDPALMGWEVSFYNVGADQLLCVAADYEQWMAAVLLKAGRPAGFVDLTSPDTGYGSHITLGQAVERAGAAVAEAYGQELLPLLETEAGLFVAEDVSTYLEGEETATGFRAFYLVSFYDERANPDGLTYVEDVVNYAYHVMVDAHTGEVVQLRTPEEFGYGRLPLTRLA